jgi:hypothetical protein
MGQMSMVPVVSTRFLEMMSELAVGWLLLVGASIAIEKTKGLADGEEGAKDRAFYAGKTLAAKYFAMNVLPGVKLKAEILGREDTSSLDISDTAFATV